MIKRPLVQALLVFAFYFAVALIITYPLITRLSSDLAGWTYGDAYETAHHMWWYGEALTTGQSPFFASNLAYPTGIDGITLWSNPLHFFPGWVFALVLPLPLAYNLHILLSLALNGLAMWFFFSDELRVMSNESKEKNSSLITHYSSLLSGLVFMLYPTMQGHLGAGHAGLLVQWTLPLAAWGLLRLRHTATWRAVILAAVLCALTAAGHPLQPIYALLPLAGTIILYYAVTRRWNVAGRAILAVGGGLLLIALFLLPVLSATFGTAAYTGEGGVVRYSADLLAIITPSFLHPLFAELEYTHRVLGINLDEGAAYLGVVVFILAIIAIWKFRAARWWLFYAGLAYLLSLGALLKVFDQPVQFTADSFVSYVTLPFAYLSGLPGFSLARTPGRFNFGLALAAAALAGYGAAWLITRFPKASRIAIPTLMILIVFEYQTFFPLPTSSGDIPQAIVNLREDEAIRAVFDVPWGNLETAKSGLYLQTGHEQPLIAGQVTRATPVDPAKLTLLENTLDPALLRDAGADIVIVHRGQDDGSLFDRAVAQLGDPVFMDDRFAVFQTPQTSAIPAFTAMPAPQTGADRAAMVVYAPEPLWVSMSATAYGEVGDTVRLFVDGMPSTRFTLGEAAAQDGESISVPVPLSEGYHTLAIAGEPPCPPQPLQGMVCAITVSDPAASPLTNAEINPVQFRAPNTDGVSLALISGYAQTNTPAGFNLPVWLYWGFERPVTDMDIRYVHLLNSAGELVAQIDTPIGTVAAGETWAEALPIPLPADLPEGGYHVYAGWYTYPDIAIYCALEDGECCANETLIADIYVGRE
jgi:hypothetical protein